MAELFHKVPFFRFLVFYAAGIFVSALFKTVLPVFSPAIILLSIFLFLGFSLSSRFNPYFATSFLALLFLAGIWRFGFFNTVPSVVNGDSYSAVLLEFPVEKKNSWKANALLDIAVDGGKTIGQKEKIIIYLEKDSLGSVLTAGDRIFFRGQPAEIRNSGNPFEFDYKKYLSNRRIYRQVYLKSDNWKLAGRLSQFNFRIFAERVRHRLLEIYQSNNITGERFAILSALTLGYKDALDPETRQVFSQTGAMHVLAVSGLHVGIVFLAFNLVFGFLKKSKRGRGVFIFSAIIFLFMFALLTGLSPSVLRATLMFSIVIIGENLRKPSNIYNTLAASAFLLLIINPNLLFDVGFQLSYCAVFGIVFFQPGICRIFQFSNKIAAWAWSLFSVSLAAQLTTFPLALYYFHQFPSYFWLSNFVVIPAAFVLIFLGMAIFILSPFPFLTSLLAKITSWLVGLVFASLKWMEQLPFSLISNINLNWSQTILLIAGVVFLMIFMVTTAKKYLFAFLLACSLVLSLNIYSRIMQIKQDRIIVYNLGDQPLLHVISGFRSFVIVGDGMPIEDSDSIAIENTRTHLFLGRPVFINADSVFVSDDLIVTGRVVNFNGMIIGLNPLEEWRAEGMDFIVTSGNRFNQTVAGKIISSGYVPAEAEKTPSFHYLKKDGAYIFDFKNNDLPERTTSKYNR